MGDSGRDKTVPPDVRLAGRVLQQESPSDTAALPSLDEETIM
jgi:hypothetical protein